MRTHAQIIREVGVGTIRAKLADRGLRVTDPGVRSWMRRPDADGSIPPAYWSALAEARVATLKELAAHADSRASRAEAA